MVRIFLISLTVRIVVVLEVICSCFRHQPSLQLIRALNFHFWIYFQLSRSKYGPFPQLEGY